MPAFHPEPTPAQGINCQISSTSTLLNFAPRRLLSAFAATSLFNHLVESGLHPCAGNGMMRRLLISLSSVVLVAFPLHAQTPAPAPQHDLKAGTIALVVTGEVLPGQMDNFRQLLTRLVAAVAEEPGTLVYEFSLQPDPEDL